MPNTSNVEGSGASSGSPANKRLSCTAPGAEFQPGSAGTAGVYDQPAKRPLADVAQVRVTGTESASGDSKMPSVSGSEAKLTCVVVVRGINLRLSLVAPGEVQPKPKVVKKDSHGLVPKSETNS